VNDKPKPNEVSVAINGSRVVVDPESHSSLLSYLRTQMQLTGSRQGCATGLCGACNVLIDGVTMQSCQVGLTSLAQSNVETIESIVQKPLGKRITKALMQTEASQCGYCLPGIVVAAYSEILTADSPDPVHALQRNLCRCGTHSRILNALKDVIATNDDEASG